MPVIQKQGVRRLGRQLADEVETIMTGERDVDRVHTSMSDLAELEVLRGMERRLKEIIHLREQEIQEGVWDHGKVEVEQSFLEIMDRLGVDEVSIAFVETPEFKPEDSPVVKIGSDDPLSKRVTKQLTKQDPYSAPFVVLPGEDEQAVKDFWGVEDEDDGEDGVTE